MAHIKLRFARFFIEPEVLLLRKFLKKNPHWRRFLFAIFAAQLISHRRYNDHSNLNNQVFQLRHRMEFTSGCNSPCFCTYRGGIALMGDRVKGIAEKWVSLFSGNETFIASQRGRYDRDGDEYHIMVVTPDENKEKRVQINDFEEIRCVHLYDLGVGCHDGCYYTAIIAPQVQKIRRKLGLTFLDLHITLGFSGSDKHGVRKDVSSLLPCRANVNEVCITAEKLLRAPSSAQGREYFRYKLIADILRREGYLCGAYYSAKFIAEEIEDPRTGHDLLEEVIHGTSDSCKVLEPELVNYGELVCQALNCNIYSQSSYYRVRRFYRSTVEQSATWSHYAFDYTEMPRNFGFVNDKLAGSSIPEHRKYFECMISIGITDVITLMEDPLRPALYVNLPIRYHFFSVIDRTPPTLEQMKEIVKICESSGKVLIHCQGGVGRTATALAAILMWEHGLSRQEAKLPLYEHRKTILDDSQDEFLSQWYEECLRNRESIEESRAKSSTCRSPKVKLPPILMCIGFPASGKSTFSETLSAAFPNQVTRINQDERGRRDCEDMAQTLSKRNGHTVILDRCNLTKAERKEWLSLAHSKKAWAISFTAPIEECRWRIVRRKGHPTIKIGGGLRIIDSVADTLEVPDLSEGFEQIIPVPTFDACNMLLRSWGCETIPISTLPEDESMIKFPRTRHILNLGCATRDDLIMTPQEVEMTFLHHELFIEEKIDGANMGISIRNNQLCAQNRSHYVSSAYHPQFKLLDKWLAQKAEDLWRILDSDRYILYGEWVYAKHSIQYKQLPDWFIAFDMYDKLEEKFWSRPRLERHLDGSNIQLIPLVSRGAFNNIGQLRVLAQTPSQFYAGPVEGVYIRRCNDEGWLTARGKIVRSDFLCGNEFWTKGGLQPNSKVLGAST